jgi:hypothetical protein
MKKILLNYSWAIYLSCSLLSTGNTFFTKEFWIIFVPTFILVFVFKYYDFGKGRNEWKKFS